MIYAQGAYFQTECQYLVSSSSATAWTNALAVLVAVTVSRLFRLLVRIYNLLFRRPQTIHRTPEAILWHELLDWRQEPQQGFIVLHAPDNNGSRSQRGSLFRLAKIILLAISYIGILACSTFTARLATNSKALASSPICGRYGHPENIGLTRMAFDSEVESAALAEKCFDAPKEADGCNYFVEQSIPFTRSSALCPFRDATMCSGGDTDVVKFSTGPVDARTLGVNTPMLVELSREMTCAPVVVNGSFARMKMENTTVLLSYYYGSSYYGVPGSDYPEVEEQTVDFVHPWDRWAEPPIYRME